MKSFYLILGTLLAGLSANSFAGVGAHGAGGLYCPGVERPVLRDLWEAETLEPRRVIVRNDESVPTQIEKALKRLEAIHLGFASRVRANLELAYKLAKPIDSTKIELSPPSDSKAKKRCRGGRDIGVALWTEGERTQFKNGSPTRPSFEYLELDPTVLALDPRDPALVAKALMHKTDQAAAWVHESVYKTLRELYPEEAQDSVVSRLLVGLAFDNSPQKIASRFDKGPRLQCLDGSLNFRDSGLEGIRKRLTEIHLYKKDDKLYMRPLILNGRIIYEATEFLVEDPLFTNLFDYHEGSEHKFVSPALTKLAESQGDRGLSFQLNAPLTEQSFQIEMWAPIRKDARGFLGKRIVASSAYFNLYYRDENVRNIWLICDWVM
jgi:hypothetical protein